MTPKQNVEAAVARWGAAEVVERCRSLLALDPAAVPTGVDAEVALALGNSTDPGWFGKGKPPTHRYWARVWAARALRYVWADSAAPSVIDALADEHWRVREMAAKVAAQHDLPGAVAALAGCCADDTPRVRAAAATALGSLGEGDDAEPVRDLLDDPDEQRARRGPCGARCDGAPVGSAGVTGLGDRGSVTGPAPEAGVWVGSREPTQPGRSHWGGTLRPDNTDPPHKPRDVVRARQDRSREQSPTAPEHRAGGSREPRQPGTTQDPMGGTPQPDDTDPAHKPRTWSPEGTVHVNRPYRTGHRARFT